MLAEDWSKSCGNYNGKSIIAKRNSKDEGPESEPKHSRIAVYLEQRDEGDDRR